MTSTIPRIIPKLHRNREHSVTGLCLPILTYLISRFLRAIIDVIQYCAQSSDVYTGARTQAGRDTDESNIIAATTN